MSTAVPLTIGFGFLLVAGYCELKTYWVPNRLTLSAIGLALLFALIAGVLAPERSGSIVSADSESRERKFDMLMHGQLPLSIGTILGVVVASLF